MSTVCESKRGASPVIGGVLMVAMVVILAATVGGYFFSFSEQEPLTAPQVAVIAEYSENPSPDGEYLNLSFESGDSIDRQNLSVVVTDAQSSDGSDVDLDTEPVQAQAPTTITAGTEISIHADQFTGISPSDHLNLSEASVRLVWRPDLAEETESYVIYRWPDPSQR